MIRNPDKVGIQILRYNFKSIVHFPNIRGTLKKLMEVFVDRAIWYVSSMQT